MVASRLAALFGSAIVTGAAFALPLWAVYLVLVTASPWTILCDRGGPRACAGHPHEHCDLPRLLPLRRLVALSPRQPRLHRYSRLLLSQPSSWGCTRSRSLPTPTVTSKRCRRSRARSPRQATRCRPVAARRVAVARYRHRRCGAVCPLYAERARRDGAYRRDRAALLPRYQRGAQRRGGAGRPLGRAPPQPKRAQLNALPRARGQRVPQHSSGVPSYAFNCLFGYLAHDCHGSRAQRGGRARVCALRCHRRCGPYARDLRRRERDRDQPAAVGVCVLRDYEPERGCSVSMEGRSAWLMATAPLPVRTVLGAKLAANALPVAGSLAVSALVLLATGQIDALGAASVLVTGFGAFYATVNIGLGLDARRPNYSWTSPARLSSEASPSHWWLSWGSCLRPWARSSALVSPPPRARQRGSPGTSRWAPSGCWQASSSLYVYLFAVDALAAELPPAACDQSLLAGHGSLIAPPRRERN